MQKALLPLLNAKLAASIASLRYGEMILVADAGFPAPKGVEAVDLALSPGMPGVADVLRVIGANLVLLEALVAENMIRVNPSLHTDVVKSLPDVPIRAIPHQEVEDLAKAASLIVQTGECSPYGNAILVGGLDFFAIDMASR